MTRKNIQNLKCANRECRRILCQTDGEFLFVGRLQIEPKMKRGKAGKYRLIVCDACGFETRLYRNKLFAPDKNQPPGKGKFLIFRSRF